MLMLLFCNVHFNIIIITVIDRWYYRLSLYYWQSFIFECVVRQDPSVNISQWTALVISVPRTLFTLMEIGRKLLIQCISSLRLAVRFTSSTYNNVYMLYFVWLNSTRGNKKSLLHCREMYAICFSIMFTVWNYIWNFI